jgi:hypothetical protein
MCELPGVEWLEYFDSFSSVEHGVLVSVVVIHGRSVERHAQRRLKAIGYDPGSNTLEIVAHGCNASESTLRYFIDTPRRIAVGQGDGTGAILVEDAGGIRTLIRLVTVPHGGSRDGTEGRVAQVTSRNGQRERYV